MGQIYNYSTCDGDYRGSNAQPQQKRYWTQVHAKHVHWKQLFDISQFHLMMTMVTR